MTSLAVKMLATQSAEAGEFIGEFPGFLGGYHG
jgi:hypothetical protein